jgi:hypothetical protein
MSHKNTSCSCNEEVLVENTNSISGILEYWKPLKVIKNHQKSRVVKNLVEFGNWFILPMDVLIINFYMVKLREFHFNLYIVCSS